MTNQDSAKSAEEEAMVLRTAHLNREVDDQIRSLAHTLDVPIADVIRYFISTGLTGVKEKIDWAHHPSSDPAAQEQLDLLRAKLNGTND